MSHHSKSKEQIEHKIRTVYHIALTCYAIPFLFLVLLIIPYVQKSTDMLFWALFLMSLFPLALTGLFFSCKGLKISKLNNLSSKKNTGYNHMFLGIPLAIVGLFGWALLFVVTS